MTDYPDFLLGDWVSVLNQNYEAETIGSFGFGVIPPVDVPSLLVSEYLRVFVTTQSGRPTWVQGLRLYQTVDTLLGDHDVISQHLILLGKPEIIKMIDYPDGYRVRLEFFRWFRDCQVSISEFALSPV